MNTAPTLTPCTIEDFWSKWDEIRPCLQELKEKWPSLAPWRIEDVYAKVVNGEAACYLTEDGFAVCLPDKEEFTGRLDLCVWIAYAPPEKRGGLLKKYLPSFIEVAKSLGYAGVSMGSLHPALNACPLLKPEYTWYRYEIPEKTRTDS